MLEETECRHNNNNNNRGRDNRDNKLMTNIHANFNARELRRRSRKCWKWGILVEVVFGLVARNRWGLYRNLGCILEIIKISIMVTISIASLLATVMAIVMVMVYSTNFIPSNPKPPISNT